MTEPSKAPPLRSLLFVPANRADRIAKALAGPADGVILDLEAAITRAEAEPARANVLAALDGHRTGHPAIVVRVSGIDEPDFAADLVTAVHPRCTAIMLAQVNSADDVRRADAAITEAEAARAMVPGAIRLVPLLETANSVRTSWDIAVASARIAYLGAAVARDGDLARSIGLRGRADGLDTLFLRSKIIVDVRAAGIDNPTCGLWTDIADLAGLRAYAKECRDLGYEGMLVIHPSHVATVHEVFTPTADEIDSWQRTIETMATAAAAGLGVARLDGQMIDAAHLATARLQLTRARQWGLVD